MIIRLISKSLITAALISAPAIPFTSSNYADVENVTNNYAAAASFDIALQSFAGSPLTSPLFTISDSQPEDEVTAEIRVAHTGTLVPQYDVSLGVTGDEALCDAFNAHVTRDGTLRYDGPLTDLYSSPAQFSGASDDWEITLQHTGDAAELQNSTCAVALTYHAWPASVSSPQGFDDTEQITGTIASGEWTATPGSVVINELMWMGSVENHEEEWLELRNMTNEEIDVTGWQIENAAAGTPGTITIPSGTIPAHGFFLISRYAAAESQLADGVTIDQVTPELNLADGGEVLTLKDSYGEVIDATPTGAWAHGTKDTTNHSMERNAVPGDGTDAGSWHTCIADGCNDPIFWNSEGDNYGTPGDVNLSENDPTSEEHDRSEEEENETDEVADVTEDNDTSEENNQPELVDDDPVTDTDENKTEPKEPLPTESEETDATLPSDEEDEASSEDEDSDDENDENESEEPDEATAEEETLEEDSAAND